MENYEHVNTALGVSGLEFQEGYVSLSEEQVQALNNAMASINQERDQARGERDDTISSIDAIDESVAKAESTEDKVNAVNEIIDGLRERPADNNDLSPKGEVPTGDTDGPIVKDDDDDQEAISKIAEAEGYSLE